MKKPPPPLLLKPPEVKESDVQPEKSPKKKLGTFERTMLIGSVLVLATPVYLYNYYPETLNSLARIIDPLAEWLISLAK